MRKVFLISRVPLSPYVIFLKTCEKHLGQQNSKTVLIINNVVNLIKTKIVYWQIFVHELCIK
jgi:hypothetical protein